jgi:toxin HigB-1
MHAETSSFPTSAPALLDRKPDPMATPVSSGARTMAFPGGGAFLVLVGGLLLGFGVENQWISLHAAIGAVFARIAVRKLAQLDAAQTLDFLRAPPGNRLEALKGDREGQHSIRVNDQLRLCFRWTTHGPEDVEIADYH